MSGWCGCVCVCVPNLPQKKIFFAHDVLLNRPLCVTSEKKKKLELTEHPSLYTPFSVYDHKHVRKGIYCGKGAQTPEQKRVGVRTMTAD